MVTVTNLTRRKPNSHEVKGVDFDIAKISTGLSSMLIDLPKHESIEERANWLQAMMQQRKIKV